MVSHELPEVLARLLQLQQQHDRLLRPVACLQEVVGLKEGVVRAVRERLVHAGSVEVPHRRAAHDVQTERAEDAEVDGRVHLLHEAALPRPRSKATLPRHRPQQPLHEKFAGEGEHDHVKGEECKVGLALAIVGRRMSIITSPGRDQRVVGRQRIREEERLVERVGGRRVDGVEEQDREDDDEGIDPGVLEGQISPSL